MATSTHLPPPVMMESTEFLRWVTHMLCCTCAMYFSAAASSENDQGSMNLASNTASVPPHDPVQGRCHPRNARMPDAPLHVADLPAGGALVPGAIELLGCPSELHDEIGREVLRFGLAPFLAPQADQRGFITAHDDAGVRAADEGAAFRTDAFRHDNLLDCSFRHR